MVIERNEYLYFVFSVFRAFVVNISRGEKGYEIYLSCLHNPGVLRGELMFVHIQGS